MSSPAWTSSPSCVLLRTSFSIVYSYDEAPAEHKPYRQKDGAMLAVGALCDKLKQTDPYKSELERMLVQHIFPEFNSPVGHLRAKVFIVFGFSCVMDTSAIHGGLSRGSVCISTKSVALLNVFESSLYHCMSSIRYYILWDPLDLLNGWFLDVGCMGSWTICPYQLRRSEQLS